MTGGGSLCFLLLNPGFVASFTEDWNVGQKQGKWKASQRIGESAKETGGTE